MTHNTKASKAEEMERRQLEEEKSDIVLQAGDEMLLQKINYEILTQEQRRRGAEWF